MEYPLIPSRERVAPNTVAAVDTFLNVWNSDLLPDIGPRLTCTETESLANLFAAYGLHDAADSLRAAHIAEDDEGDDDHNE